MRFCEKCDNILIPKGKKLYCKACNEEFELNDEYKIVKKIKHDEKETAPIVVEQAAVGRSAGGQDLLGRGRGDLESGNGDRGPRRATVRVLDFDFQLPVPSPVEPGGEATMLFDGDLGVVDPDSGIGAVTVGDLGRVDLDEVGLELDSPVEFAAFVQLVGRDRTLLPVPAQDDAIGGEAPLLP